jgi:hypothetical protein
MPFKAHVMGSGSSAGAANNIIGGVNTTVVGAGTTAAGATLLPFSSMVCVNTAANNSGVILPPGNGTGDIMQPHDSMIIYNGDANTLLLYPPAGGKLNSGTATTGTVSIATHTSVTAFSIDGVSFVVQGPNT